MGEVYRGTWAGCDVAIKMVLAGQNTKEAKESFINEIGLQVRSDPPCAVERKRSCTGQVGT
jgi:hypothetical protein